MACTASKGKEDASTQNEAGVTKPPCSDTMPCSGGLSCCANQCTNISRDPDNCGGCGMACGASRFCTGMTCADVSLQHLCDNAKATVVLDGAGTDDDTGRAVASSIMAACPSLMIRYAGTSSADVLAGDKRPITGPGDTLVTAGGPFFQPSVQFMESSLAPVFSQSTANGARVQLIVRKTGTPLVDVDVASLTEKHDYFLLQVVLEPISGTLTLMTYGIYPTGTVAAGFFVKNNVMPNLATWTDRWYVYEWKDSDVVPGPTANDTFTKLGSGS